VDDALKITRRRQKHILREAMRGIVPDKVLDVPKLPQRMGYDLEFSQALDQLVSKYLSPTRVNERGFFDPLEISTLTQRHPSKPYGAEWGMRLWTAVLTEIWAETFIDQRGQFALEDAKTFPSVTAKVAR
jgi:asparagine synthase (glutamine-hydrolysing)